MLKVEQNLILAIEDSIKAGWDLPALGNYKVNDYTYGQVGEQILKLHLLYEKCGIKQGDKVALKIFERMGEYIGIGLASVVNLLNPEKIVIGGGVADAGDILFKPIIATIQKRAMPIQAKSVQVVKAQLGNAAGVIGASLLVES